MKRGPNPADTSVAFGARLGGDRVSAQHCIAVIDDDAIVRTWLRRVLEAKGFSVRLEAGTASEATQILPRSRTSVVLVDQRLPDRSGTELVHSLREADCLVPAIVMSATPIEGLNEAAREAGAQGTYLKTGRAVGLLAAIQRVLEGECSFDSGHPARPPGLCRLTPREREVLRRASDGATNREIAGELDVSSETVKTLLARSFLKLGARRRTEAVAVARRFHLI